MKNVETDLKKKVFQLIDEKRKAMQNFSDNHLRYVTKDINRVQAYIDCNFELTEQDIENLISNLVQYRIVLDIPLELAKEMFIARAVKARKNLIINHVSEVSYIPEHLLNIATLGRFNFDKQSIFYGSILASNDDSQVLFSEIGVQHNDDVNILISKITQDVNVVIIGLFDYYKQENGVFSLLLHPIFGEIYDYYQKSHETDLLKAIELTDDFFRRITTHPCNPSNSQKRYSVTSILGKLLLEDEGRDGIIYPSVKDNKTVNIAIKPLSVDNKLEYLEVRAVKYTETEDIIQVAEIDIGNVSHDGNIQWSRTLRPTT